MIPHERATVEAVRGDFDRIADLSEAWDHNIHYHPYLLRQIPAGSRAALDIGCGTGAFACAMAQRGMRVTAIDLSAAMIARARGRAAGMPGIAFEQADFSTFPLPEAHFDCIASIATFHHLPMPPALLKAAQALRPGGVLLLLDLYRIDDAAGHAFNLLGAIASRPLRFLHTGRFRPPRAVRDAWEAHARHDCYRALGEVRRLAGAVLPGARIRRHVFWRYSLVWRKPA